MGNGDLGNLGANATQQQGKNQDQEIAIIQLQKMEVQNVLENLIKQKIVTAMANGDPGVLGANANGMKQHKKQPNQDQGLAIIQLLKMDVHHVLEILMKPKIADCHEAWHPPYHLHPLSVTQKVVNNVYFPLTMKLQ